MLKYKLINIVELQKKIDELRDDKYFMDRIRDLPEADAVIAAVAMAFVETEWDKSLLTVVSFRNQIFKIEDGEIVSEEEGIPVGLEYIRR